MANVIRDTVLKDSHALRDRFGSYGIQEIASTLSDTLDGIENQLNSHLRAAIVTDKLDLDEDQIVEYETALGQRMAEKFIPLIQTQIEKHGQAGLSLTESAHKLNDTLAGLTDESLHKIAQENIKAVLATPAKKVTGAKKKDPGPVTSPQQQQTKPKPQNPAAARPQVWSGGSSSSSKGGSWSSRSSGSSSSSSSKGGSWSSRSSGGK